MTESFYLRRFRTADADAVYRVHEAALRASPLAFVEEAAVDEDVTEIQASYLDEGGEFLVGEITEATTETDESSIVAIGGYLPVDGETVGEETIEIRRMRVDPEHQREGHASRLLAALEDRAREAGYGVAELETVEPLRAAQAFYENAGYEVVEETVQEATGIPRYRYRTEL